MPNIDAIASRAMLEQAIMENLSPEAARLIVAALQVPVFHAYSEDSRSAVREVNWFAEVLTGIIGSDFDRIGNELGIREKSE